MLRFDFDFDLSHAFQRVADAVEGFLAKDAEPQRPHIRLRANEDHAPTPLPRFALRRSGVAAHREPGSIGHSIFGGHSEELGLRAKALDPRQSSSL